MARENKKGRKSRTISPGYLLSAICVRKGGRNLRPVLVPHILFLNHRIFAWVADFVFLSFRFYYFTVFALAIFLFILVFVQHSRSPKKIAGHTFAIYSTCTHITYTNTKQYQPLEMVFASLDLTRS